MKTLIINSAGLIGISYIDYLSQYANIDHYIFSDNAWNHIDPAILNRITYVHNDDLSAEHALLQDISVIIYIAPRPDFSALYEELYNQHVVYSQKLLKLVQDTQAQHFICVSSDMVYFQLQEQYNIKEQEIAFNMIHDYARVIDESEKVLHLLDQNITTTFLRPGCVYNETIHEIKNYLPRGVCHLYHEQAQIHLTHTQFLNNALYYAQQDRIGGTYNIHDIAPATISTILPHITIKKHHPKLLKMAIAWRVFKENIARKLDLPIQNTVYHLALFNYTHTYNNELAKEKLHYLLP